MRDPARRRRPVRHPARAAAVRGRLGVIGPNGAGKSTFLDVLAGRLTPAEGTAKTGATVALGMFDQRGLAMQN